MTKEEIEVGVQVCIPATKDGSESESFLRSVYYLNALLANWQYPHSYLVVGEPCISEDNVRLYMTAPFPQFCVESFHLKDLVLAGGGATTL